jgi:two-component system, chemotaxis family, CheB/CheR fusion protein
MTVTISKENQMQTVVGLGGSAGSIRALQAFFCRMPVDSGLAFVVVLHLSPEHESSLAALLQKVSALRSPHW